MKIEFVSLDQLNRKVTLSVDGVEYTRGIAFNIEDFDEYVLALAKGLAIEQKAKLSVPIITNLSQGSIVFEDSVEK